MSDGATTLRLPRGGFELSDAAPVALLVLAIAALYATSSMALAAIAVLVLVAAAAVWPATAVASVPATLAIINLDVHVGHLEFSPTETLLVATVVGVGVRAAVVLVTSRFAALRLALPRAVGLVSSGSGPVALALLAVGTLSLFTVADRTYLHESLRWYRWTIVEPVVFVFLARWFLDLRRDRMTGAVLYVGAAALAGAWALGALAHGGGLAVQGVVRISGTYPQPNALALYLERPLPFAVALAVAYRKRWQVAWLVPAALCGLAVLLTFSRGAWVGAGIAVLVVLWLGGWRRLAVAIAALEVVAGAVLAVVDRRRVLNLFHGGSGSLRIDIWTAALHMLRDHPIFGVGLDQFLYQYAPRYVLPGDWAERFTSHPHDIVLDVWLSLGIMGLIVAAAIVVVVIVQTRRAIGLHHRLGLAAAGALLAGGIHGLVDNGYFLPDLALAFWFFMAIIDLEARKPAADDAPAQEIEGD